MIIEIFQFWIELYILQTKQIPCLSANKFFFLFYCVWLPFVWSLPIDLSGLVAPARG